MKNPHPIVQKADPWQDSTLECRAYPQTPQFMSLLQDLLGERVRFMHGATAAAHEVILVDCRTAEHEIGAARKRYSLQAIVAVIERADTALVIRALAAGPDGVIALADPVAVWLECLNVVRGGARWMGGPGLEVNLEHKYAGYEIAKRENHEGDVTMRTQSFVRSRVPEKFRH